MKDQIPDFNLNISTSKVVAKPRRLKAQWSASAADSLREMWGGRPRYPRLPDNELDLLRDALEDPNYDPDSHETYKGLWRWEDGRVATPEEVQRVLDPEGAMISSMADEIRKEIDREIMNTLATQAITNSKIIMP